LRFTQMTDLNELFLPGASITGNSKEQVGGKDTTRYEILSDVAKAHAEAPPEEKAMFRMALDGGVTRITHSVWLDDAGLPVKVDTVTPPTTVRGKQIGEVTVTHSFRDWGKPVSITPPPAEQTQEMTG
jgi:hypothetical protein